MQCCRQRKCSHLTPKTWAKTPLLRRGRRTASWGRRNSYMARKLRVGFVGLGRVVDLNVRGYLDHPEAEDSALYDA
jgi:hypothetical protein